MPDPLVDEIDRLIRHDPACRGLIGSEPEYGPLCPGHLAAAARHLAAHARRVVIVTGFYIPRAEPPAAETDGPPGALLLAEVLRAGGAIVQVATDPPCAPAVQAAARAGGFPESLLHVSPASGLENWGRGFLAAGDVPVTHLIAIERPGPSHTRESLAAQLRDGMAPIKRFERLVPQEHRDHCHNMRGEVIDAWTARLDRLFSGLSDNYPEARTIGIGDGGNEIGMGSALWEDLERRLAGEQSGRVPCRVACTWNIVAGTSNWGAYALAAAFAAIRDEREIVRPFTAAHQRRVLETMVAEGPAVDGVTRRREATVDGLPFETYIQCWEGMRRLLGLG